MHAKFMHLRMSGMHAGIHALLAKSVPPAQPSARSRLSGISKEM